jgi:hypothetical protein
MWLSMCDDGVLSQGVRGEPYSSSHTLGLTAGPGARTHDRELSGKASVQYLYCTGKM